MEKELLKKYAKLIIKIGVNIKKDQVVEIFSDVNNEELVSLVSEEAYANGASLVNVNWTSQKITKLNYSNASTEVLAKVPKHIEELWNERVETLPAMVHILSEDPDNLKDIDPKKISEVRKGNLSVIMPIRQKIMNMYQWTIVAVPSPKWALKVFPDLNENDAIEALWDAIYKTARVYGDPIENWNKHNDFIHEKCNKLNSLNIRTLKYKSSNGTDFSIDLLDELEFHGAGSYTKGGNYYNPNMPTEECFTSPNKNSANGYLYASKPLSLNGMLLKDFGFKFENGKVVEIFSKEDSVKIALEGLINTDEGASRLGECALVSFDSPVNQTGLIFYNTLFDENACCHFALGYGFNDCVKDFENKTNEELNKLLINRSFIHVDFMVGTNDLSIIGITKEDKEIQIFRDGTWAL